MQRYTMRRFANLPSESNIQFFGVVRREGVEPPTLRFEGCFGRYGGSRSRTVAHFLASCIPVRGRESLSAEWGRHLVVTPESHLRGSRLPETDRAVARGDDRLPCPCRAGDQIAIAAGHHAC